MSRRIKRTILVAKDYERQLQTSGQLAERLFRNNQDLAYQRVIEDMELKQIQHLDLKLDVSSLPGCLGCWYFDTVGLNAPVCDGLRRVS